MTILAPGTAQHRHLPALDGVRGLAIAAVLVVHSVDLAGGWPYWNLINILASVGPFGVDLFFVLSGFLITGVLLDSRGEHGYFRNFYARRALRLFPVYYSYLLVVMTLVPWMHRALHTSIPDYSGNWWWYFTYITNWKANFAAPDLYLGHFWSLAVEEQFYVVWPTVVLLLARRRLAWACAALIISATILRCVWSAQGVYWNQIYRLTVTRWDTMAMGALCALALRSESARNWAYRSAPILMAVGGSVFVTIAVKAGGPEWSRGAIQTFGSTAASVAFCGLVLYAATRNSGRLYDCLRLRFLLSLGKYSYFMYVIHILVIEHVYRLGRHFAAMASPGPATAFIWIAQLIVANAVVFYLARLSWNFFESPILRLKRHFV